MADVDVSAKQRVHDALTQRGFKRDWSSDRVIYVGELDPNALKVPIRIDVTDLDFVRPPPIRVEEGYDVTGRRLPHLLDEARSFCYYATGTVVLDRYNPGGTVLQCLEQADDVMRQAVRGKSDADFANEMQAYWSSSFVLVDLPRQFTGRVKLRYLNLRGSGAPTGVLCTDGSWLLDAHRANGSPFPKGEDCVVVSIGNALTLNPDTAWPPTNLSALNVWLKWLDPELVGVLERSFVSGEGPTRWVAIRASNGTFILSASLPAMLRTDEFQKSRRTSIPAALNRVATKTDIERTIGMPADTDYIFSRNLGTQSNLAGKRILLIGAGTIGGFLAHQLAQSGAGANGGRLTIVDTDELRTANLGRHLLGLTYINTNKAEGCCAFIKQQLPMLDIEFLAKDALTAITGQFMPYDLMIDVTGEEALSLAINERAIRSGDSYPPVLFGYLLGNGALAQALLTEDRKHACLKCLKPDLAGAARFPSLRPGVDVVTERNMECADPHYIPYPVTRSVVAASLVCEMALAWASGSIGQRFRSHLFDASQAYRVKDGNPAPSRDCPACSRT
ncbi:ThiF family adenylyltransferase [Rhizobium etli]|uniref:ThiF family adenylyltransferase n=1 Tax=Rhizobium etli TaxID=29449 RepID=UPI00038393E7|nr:ThiF family adenylyltransferase [Rhizobium etli]AGS25657.1 UBA/THIF-type NAD/FAD binding domain-containing protein [Rhizobium etli bv. mimosae str. Mim1]